LPWLAVNSASVCPLLWQDAVMAFEWEQVIIDSRDSVQLGSWWREVLGWVVVDDRRGEFEIRPTADTIPGLLFAEVPDIKQVKNRLHLDLRPDDQAAEVARLEGLGASRVDIGQGDQPWVVMSDPEGNEFCVLRERQNRD
jgi:Glyoxalase-like domain